MTQTTLQHLHQKGIITTRQLEILELRRRGLSQYQIALGLRISRDTVKSTERAALAKIARHHEQETAA